MTILLSRALLESVVRFNRYDSAMVIMGVDPGSRITGYGFVSYRDSSLQCVEYGAIRVAVGGKLPNLPQRLLTIHAKLKDLIQKYNPEVVAVEGVFYAANVRSALTLGHVRGVVLLAASEAEIPLVEYAPMEVKKALTGYGKADKRQVQTMVKALLNLESLPEPHDASDALALAICESFQGTGSRHQQTRWKTADLPRSWRKMTL